MTKSREEVGRHPWLRGYFYVMAEHDIVGGDRSHVAMRKNVDFMRLRDAGLHLLGPVAGKKVLDLGCADGASMTFCGLLGAEVHGVDIDEDGVKQANALLEEFGISGRAHVSSAAELPFEGDAFDAVVASDFFEHIDRRTKVQVLGEARRVLKPGGRLVIKTPNLTYLRMALAYKRVRALLRLRDPFRVVIPHSTQHDQPEHIGLTTRWELTGCLLDAGFLNYRFEYAPLRRFGRSAIIEVLSTEVPLVRDLISEDLICLAYKPISLSYFPD